MRSEMLPSKQDKNGADETTFRKKRSVQRFYPGIIREASRLGICSITQWGNMEREGGGNIVATRIARGHKYHFDLLGCERMARVSRA